MLAINAAATSLYTAMSHNAAYSMMRTNMARMSLLNSPNFAGMDMKALAAYDKRLACQSLQDSLRYRIANAMLERQKALQKKSSKLDTFA